MEKVNERVLTNQRVTDFFDELDANYQQQLIWEMRDKAKQRERMKNGEYQVGDELMHMGQRCKIHDIDVYLPRGYLIRFMISNQLKYVGKEDLRLID